MREQFCLTDLLEGILVESCCRRFPADGRFLHQYFYSCWDGGKYPMLMRCSFNVSGEYPRMCCLDQSLWRLEEMKLILPAPDGFFDVSSKIRSHYAAHVKEKIIPPQDESIKGLARDFSRHMAGWVKTSNP